MATTSYTYNPPKFPQFTEFHEDLCRLILSFVADGPLEEKIPTERGFVYRPSALAQTLPLVSKPFYKYSQEDYFWKPALHRQLQNADSNHLWKDGLRRFLPKDYRVDDNTDVLQAVLDHHGESVTHKEIYKKVTTRHIRFQAPIFIMPCQLQMGEVYSLHLFEPRYRIMVRDVVDRCENPEEARCGGVIREGRYDDMLEPAVFIHACLGSHLRPGVLACLVQIVWCRTYDYGTVDVQLKPVAWVRLEKIWVRPSSGHLCYAKATRI